MSPQGTPKPSTKVQRTAKEMPVNNILDARVSRQPTSTVPKVNSPQLKDNGSVPVLSRTKSIRRSYRKWSPKPAHSEVPVPKANSPQLKDNGSVPVLSRTKSIRRSYRKWSPKPAHSGVPVPEEMKKLVEKELQDSKFQV